MGADDTELASVHFSYRQEAAREEGAPRPALYRPRQGPVLVMLLDGLRFLFPGIIPLAGAATGYTGPARQPRYKPRSWLIADAVNVQCKCKSSGCRPR